MKLKLFILLLISIQLVFGSAMKVDDNEKLLNTYVKDLENLSRSQLLVLMKSYAIGLEYGLEYVLPVIAWKESNFGKYMVNLSDGEFGSFGYYHIRLDYSLKRNNLKNSWSRDRHAEKLMNDIDYSAAEAIKVINYWHSLLKARKVKNNIDRKLFSAYNGGYKYNGAMAKSYGEDAVIRVKALQMYITKYAFSGKLIIKQLPRLVLEDK